MNQRLVLQTQVISTSFGTRANKYILTSLTRFLHAHSFTLFSGLHLLVSLAGDSHNVVLCLSLCCDSLSQPFSTDTCTRSPTSQQPLDKSKHAGLPLSAEESEHVPPEPTTQARALFLQHLTFYV